MTMRGGEDRSIRMVGPPEALEQRCLMDGTLRQHARVANVIRDVPRLLSYTSSAVDAG
ncbi:hypothetical protein [Streptomyces sp. NPDC002588]|uniref:hypothetical protein n=1 Tax=Streptomyces sp. NPDC002588 TaxID=3154419 RepID=UPI0033244204